MPALVNRDTTVSVLADVRARLAKLETTPPAGMTELCTTGPLGNLGALGFTLTQALIPGSSTPTFTLTRPSNIFVVGSIVFTTTGGTASYGYGNLILTTAGWTPGAEVVGSARIAHTNDTVHPTFASDSSRYITALACPPGTYAAYWTYYLDAGATTTFTFESGQIDVFLLAG